MEKMDALAALGALSQETRLDVFRLLVKQGPNGLSAGQIGATLGSMTPASSLEMSSSVASIPSTALIDSRMGEISRSRPSAPISSTSVSKDSDRA